MAVTFSRTLQALEGDRPAWRLAGLTIIIVLPALLVWLFLAKITVYEVSSSARLESVPQNVASEVEGLVVESMLHIGLEVTEGQVLVRLNDRHIGSLIEESQKQIDAAKSEIKERKEELAVRERSLTSLIEAKQLAVEEAKENKKVADLEARLAQQNYERAKSLGTGFISEEERDQKRADAETAQAKLRTAELGVGSTEQDYISKEQIQQAEMARIRRELVTVEGELEKYIAHHETLGELLEQRTIRANVAGRVEEVVPFRIGDVVKPAEKLATIVPQETPRIVAFLPVISVGRVLPGQSARLRMDGFPWTQYGTLAANVAAVGNEPFDGLIRVELDISDHSSRIPLKHGQTASVEIAVEHASPAMLILRAAGEFLMTHRDAASNP